MQIFIYSLLQASHKRERKKGSDIAKRITFSSAISSGAWSGEVGVCGAEVWQWDEGSDSKRRINENRVRNNEIEVYIFLG